MYRYIYALSFLLIISCKKEEAKPEFSSTPVISLLEATPSSVKAWQDSISFKIAYEDGDGDLGENKAGLENLFLTDTRTGATYGYRIPAFVPYGNKAAIKGVLSFVLPYTLLTSETAQSENVSFEIKIKDRARHESNTVSTGNILVTR